VAAGAGDGDRAGGTGRWHADHQFEVGFVAVLCAVLTIALGIYPDPLFDVARDAGAALADLL